jgi:DNA topoisomerase-6 subunit B
MECGRKLGTYLRKRQKMQREAARRDVFERYIGEISKAVNAINGTDAKKLYDALLKEARKRTAIADAQLDEEGKTVKNQEQEDLKNDEGVVLIESRVAHVQEGAAAENSPASPDGTESGNGDVVRLTGKPKKKSRRKSSDADNNLF